MTTLTFQVPSLFDYFATFLWALSGAILAAMGGSTLRDGLFLNQLPPVVTNGWYLPLILFAAIIVRFFWLRIADTRLVDNLINLIDALGVPAFAAVGMQLSLEAGLPAPGVVLIGMINGFGGGFLRDIAVGNTPAALKPGRFNLSAGFFVCAVRRPGDISSSRRGRRGLGHHRLVLRHSGAGGAL
jgi:uncharacterized membrane protein YeiH